MKAALASLALLLLPAAAAAQPFKYVAFGDSITAGYLDENNTEGYPAKLVSLLQSAGRTVAIVKSGVGGETTAQGLTRLDGVLAQEAPQVVLLSEGTNDVFSNSISSETAHFNLEQMAAKATNEGVDTVHITIIPMKAKGSNTPHAKNGEAAYLADLVEQSAVDHDYWLVSIFDIWSGIPNLYATLYDQWPDDPVGHPHNAGFWQMAGDIRDVLVSPLPGSATPTAPLGDIVTASPSFDWQTASGATFYRLELRDAAGGVLHALWHKALSVCSGASCSVTLAAPLPAGGAYSWTVQPRSPAGLGPQSTSQGFTYWDAPPGESATLAPGGPTFQTDPEFSWVAVASTVQYQLEVTTGAGGGVHDAWYDAATVCASGVCSAQPTLGLTAGDYLWRVTGANPAGSSPATPDRAFEVRDCPAQHDLTVGPGQLSTTALYEACGTVTVTGFEILSGGDATVHAGTAVVFENGSSVAASGLLTVYVD